jgi:phospholipid/cholesterol/gamma-HCH transport system substrate-binding protein
MSLARLAGIGAFVLGGLLLFAVGLFLIGDRRGLFREQFELYTEFSRLGGLESGATVRVAGMEAGEVVEIRVPVSPAAPFRVRMRVRQDLQRLVRRDSVASIQNDGLVGNKFVHVEAGTPSAPAVAPGETIPGRDPFDLADLLQQASETIRTINTSVTALASEIEVAVATVSTTARHASVLVQDVGDDVRVISEAGARIASDMQAISRDVRSGRGTVGKLVTDDELYRRATEIARQVEETIGNVQAATAQARQALASFTAKDGPAQGLSGDVRQTMDQAREAMSDLAENAEALKHNWFFRGFFKRRGYFDLNDLTVQEYVEGALDGDTRKPLRIWLRGPLLFEEVPGAGNVLSEGGRARLDSAMSTFLRYPRNSPLVIEGYATAPTRDERFLRARDRSAAVLEYLREKFQLDGEHVAIMPIGAPAPGSPGGGDTWDGVALALFVDKAALAQPQ